MGILSLDDKIATADPGLLVRNLDLLVNNLDLDFKSEGGSAILRS